MALGYDGKLYILAFDHRGSFQKKMFGIEGDPTSEQVDTISDAKRLIFEGTVATGRRAHRLEVGAAAGLGERHRGPDLPGRHLREQPLTLLLGAELSDELGDDAVPAHRSGQAHPAARELGGDVDVAPGGDRSPA